MQLIDARDLAAWVIDSLERNLHGTYNAVPAPNTHDFASMLAACGATDVIWVPEEFLLEQGVTPFADLPLWLPGTLGNMFRVSNAAAAREGLTTRPLEQSAHDTLAWFREQDRTLTTGLTTEREAEVLADWKVRSSAAGPE